MFAKQADTGVLCTYCIFTSSLALKAKRSRKLILVDTKQMYFSVSLPRQDKCVPGSCITREKVLWCNILPPPTRPAAANLVPGEAITWYMVFHRKRSFWLCLKLDLGFSWHLPAALLQLSNGKDSTILLPVRLSDFQVYILSKMIGLDSGHCTCLTFYIIVLQPRDNIVEEEEEERL